MAPPPQPSEEELHAKLGNIYEGVNNPADHTNCVICLHPFGGKAGVVLYLCGCHSMYCCDCLDAWLDQKEWCCNCKQTVTKADWTVLRDDTAYQKLCKRVVRDFNDPANQERLKQERLQREEKERLRQQEQERLKRERLQREEEERLDKERKQEQERLAKEQEEEEQRNFFLLQLNDRILSPNEQRKEERRAHARAHDLRKNQCTFAEKPAPGFEDFRRKFYNEVSEKSKKRGFPLSELFDDSDEEPAPKRQKPTSD